MRPHDLLWLRAPLEAAALPDWAEPGWPVVVRRARAGGRALVPVGLRGRLRHQRHAAWVAASQSRRTATPEALAREAGWTSHAQAGLACLQTLARLAPRLDALGLAWGPTGSAGFALATGESVLREESDLDLLVRADTPPHPRQVAGLAMLTAEARCRLDIQVDTGRAGFALGEWLAGRSRVLLKTAEGPRLVRDPWQAADEAVDVSPPFPDSAGAPSRLRGVAEGPA